MSNIISWDDKRKDMIEKKIKHKFYNAKSDKAKLVAIEAMLCLQCDDINKASWLVSGTYEN